MIVDRDTQAAFHEAGHAVVARLLSMQFNKSGFAISVDEDTAVTKISLRSVDKASIIDLMSLKLAGGVAQYRLSELADGCVSDAKGIFYISGAESLVSDVDDGALLSMSEIFIAIIKDSKEPERVFESLRPDLLQFLHDNPTIDIYTCMSAAFVTRRLVFAYWEQITLLANHLKTVRQMTAKDLTNFFKLYGVTPEKKTARRLLRARQLKFIITTFWEESGHTPDDPSLIKLMRSFGFVPIPGPLNEQDSRRGRRRFVESHWDEL